MINTEVVSECKLWTKKIRKPSIFFNTLARGFPKRYRFIKKKVSLTVLLSDNKNIKKLNKKFRNKNKTTDVLSFPSERKLDIKKRPYIGDIVISYDFINKPKTLNILKFKNKVAKIFIHSFLHLLGYDHIKLKDYKKMLAEEEKIFQTIETKIAKLV